MSREQVCERISAWFEPKPVLGPRWSLPDSGTVRKYSVKEAWYTDDGGKTWHHQDWDTDEAANARLLEAMPRGSLNHRDDRDVGSEQVWECNANGFLDGPIMRHRGRKTAVVLAFAKFARIELSEE